MAVTHGQMSQKTAVVKQRWQQPEVHLLLPKPISEASKSKQFFQCFRSTLLILASTSLVVQYSLP